MLDFSVISQQLGKGSFAAKPRLNYSRVDGKDKVQDSTEITEREYELITFLSQGYTQANISRVLNISIKTIENHITNITRKSGLKRSNQFWMLLSEADRQMQIESFKESK